MRRDALELDPAKNPGVLDTATWDPAAAWQATAGAGERWREVQEAAIAGRALPRLDGVTPFTGSCAVRGAAVFCLAALPDGQQVFVEIGSGGGPEALGEPMGTAALSHGLRLAAYPTDASVVARYCETVKPGAGPQPMGGTPRLGIGVRMTTAVWPGIFDAMTGQGFAANPIQNSVRELNLLADLLAARPAPQNYACGFGTIASGYTGSSWEGLWLSGVLSALQYETPVRYGADADHIQVKRGADGLARARRIIEAARHYSFYTLDMADVLDYAALSPSAASPGSAQLARKIPDERIRRDVLAYHREPAAVGAATYRLDEESVGRLVGKYRACPEKDRNEDSCSHNRPSISMRSSRASSSCGQFFCISKL